MPKCGSSALQTYLSGNSFLLEGYKRRIAYLSIHSDGTVYFGKDLVSKALQSKHGYISSHSGMALSNICTKTKIQVISFINSLSTDFDTIILSNESWGLQHNHFLEDCIFSQPHFEVYVVAYVRPQVEWMNSAWWQWGAWTEIPLPQWINSQKKKILWGNLFEKWSQKSWVKGVEFRILENDITADFFSKFNIVVNDNAKFNLGLPESLLRLFQRNRDLRPHPHSSSIDFVLSRLLSLSESASPWVLKPEMVKRLLDFFQKDNELLLSVLSSDQKKILLNNPRWWDLNAYSDKIVRPVYLKNLPVELIEPLTINLIKALIRLDEDYRKL